MRAEGAFPSTLSTRRAFAALGARGAVGVAGLLLPRVVANRAKKEAAIVARRRLCEPAGRRLSKSEKYKKHKN